MDNSTVFEWLVKIKNLKAGKQSSPLVNIGPTSHKIIDTKKKEKLHTQLKASKSLNSRYFIDNFYCRKVIEICNFY